MKSILLNKRQKIQVSRLYFFSDAILLHKYNAVKKKLTIIFCYVHGCQSCFLKKYF
jgi:hypothetical protein